MPQRVLLVLFWLLTIPAWAQSPNATISGRILDPSKAVIPNATVEAINVDTNIRHTTQTNDQGLFTIGDLAPGNYRIEVSKQDFKRIVKPNVTLHVQDVIALNFDMSLGSTTESVTVEGGAPLVNTQDASVSTVVDRNFAENLPMNGRSFQTLIQLTPGVVLTPNNGLDTGQFSVNGQRAASNYWTVDGVSANTGISAFATTGNGLAGTLGASSVLGGTNSLVSVDALQEFRIQTSTFAPEFGRTPGAQISIVTRAGTNQFHGTAFEYLRNDIFDANDWFANSKRLAKSQERQNDFGGTFSGPFLKDKTFFFFSYEGLRLRLPQTRLTNVPDLTARQQASSAMQPYMNVFPLPNGPDNATTQIAQFNASFSNPALLDAYSLRVDHRVTKAFGIFGRYNYSPSELDQRGISSAALSVVAPAKITNQTATLGTTWSLSPVLVNDGRFNYSATDSSSSFRLDTFGGAVPLSSLPFPSSFTAKNAQFALLILSLGASGGRIITVGRGAHNEQRQFNVVDNVSVQSGSHAIKVGIDFRRLSPSFGIAEYTQQPQFLGVPQAKTGNTRFTAVRVNPNATFLFRNLGLYAQDSWRIGARLTLTYGLRWDVDFVPTTISGPEIPAVTGFNIHNLSSFTLAPAGTPAYRTSFGNVSPRVGCAYQLSQSQEFQSVIRGGFGVFYDLASAEAGNNVSFFAYPFGASVNVAGTFPLPPGAVAPPAIVAPGGGFGSLYAYDPNLHLPYTLQWNVAIEQGLGKQQSITASYIGAAGRRLLQTAFISKPNPNYSFAQLVFNGATSDYEAMQFQFQRHLAHGLQALASYTWAHSIDTASASSAGNFSNAFSAVQNPDVDRGASDFDVRHAFSSGLTYDIGSPKRRLLGHLILGGWSFESVFQGRSAPPVNVFYGSFFTFPNGFEASVRPDILSGHPFYQFGSRYPGDKALNIAAFTAPPTNASGLPVRQGNLGRNALRGFGAFQWDAAVHRDFQIREALKLQFRAEIFNVLNHPNFGQPIADLGSPGAINPQFGQATQMLGQSLSGTAGGGAGTGAFSPLYQIGGPRSIQLALKLFF